MARETCALPIIHRFLCFDVSLHPSPGPDAMLLL